MHIFNYQDEMMLESPPKVNPEPIVVNGKKYIYKNNKCVEIIFNKIDKKLNFSDAILVASIENKKLKSIKLCPYTIQDHPLWTITKAADSSEYTFSGEHVNYIDKSLVANLFLEIEEVLLANNWVNAKVGLVPSQVSFSSSKTTNTQEIRRVRVNGYIYLLELQEGEIDNLGLIQGYAELSGEYSGAKITIKGKFENGAILSMELDQNIADKESLHFCGSASDAEYIGTYSIILREEKVKIVLIGSFPYSPHALVDANFKEPRNIVKEKYSLPEERLYYVYEGGYCNGSPEGVGKITNYFAPSHTSLTEGTFKDGKIQLGGKISSRETIGHKHVSYTLRITGKGSNIHTGHKDVTIKLLDKDIIVTLACTGEFSVFTDDILRGTIKSSTSDSPNKYILKSGNFLHELLHSGEHKQICSREVFFEGKLVEIATGIFDEDRLVSGSLVLNFPDKIQRYQGRWKGYRSLEVDKLDDPKGVFYQFNLQEKIGCWRSGYKEGVCTSKLAFNISFDENKVIKSIEQFSVDDGKIINFWRLKIGR